ANWTAPFSDPDCGPPYGYEFRIATTADSLWTYFSSCFRAPSGTPAREGTPQCLDFRPLACNADYYYALKALYPGGGTSPLSNVFKFKSNCRGATLTCPQGFVGPTASVLALDALRLDPPTPNPTEAGI